MKPKMLKIDNNRIKQADTIESILCLTALIATDRLPYNASLEDSFNFWDSLGYPGCDICDLKNSCLDCIMNE